MTGFDIAESRRFGRIDQTVSVAGFGSVALGNMGKEMAPETAGALIRHALDAGVRLFDTAPMYGHGLAEYRLAAQLMERPRESYVLVTKVGRTLHPAPPGSFDTGPWTRTPPMRMEFDYSYDGVMRQVEDSLQRMGVDHFDALLVHDIDRWTHGADQPQRFREALDGAFPALEALRDQGVVNAIGLGVNEVDVCLAAAHAVDIDCVLIAGTYSLLDQEADRELLPLCVQRGIAVINGRVFGSGILATGAGAGARYNYGSPDEATTLRVRRLEDVCERHGVELGAAAVQFAAANPAISNVCIGAGSVEQQQRNYDWFGASIPAAFWDELKAAGLLDGAAAVPGGTPIAPPARNGREEPENVR